MWLRSLVAALFNDELDEWPKRPGRARHEDKRR
jgi:hypothetical protein